VDSTGPSAAFIAKAEKDGAGFKDHGNGMNGLKAGADCATPAH